MNVEKWWKIQAGKSKQEILREHETLRQMQEDMSGRVPGFGDWARNPDGLAKEQLLFFINHSSLDQLFQRYSEKIGATHASVLGIPFQLVLEEIRRRQKLVQRPKENQNESN